MKAWRDLRELPRGVWVLLATTLVNRAGTMVLPFLILYLTRELHFTDGRAGLVMGLFGAGAPRLLGSVGPSLRRARPHEADS
jgi:predicted MFS family arabinose efflux permease